MPVEEAGSEPHCYPDLGLQVITGSEFLGRNRGHKGSAAVWHDEIAEVQAKDHVRPGVVLYCHAGIKREESLLLDSQIEVTAPEVDRSCSQFGEDTESIDPGAEPDSSEPDGLTEVAARILDKMIYDGFNSKMFVDIVGKPPPDARCDFIEVFQLQ